MRKIRIGGILIGVLIVVAVAGIGTWKLSIGQKEIEFKVTLKQAAAQFAKQYPKVQMTKIAADTSFGQPYYDIEGVQGKQEIEGRMDATSGKLSDTKIETLDWEEQQELKTGKNYLELNQLISREQASRTALKRVGKGHATDWELEKEQGQAVWTVTVAHFFSETDVLIDAVSGAVLHVEKDD